MADPAPCSQKRKLGRLFNFSVFVRGRERQIHRGRSGMLAAMLAVGVRPALGDADPRVSPRSRPHAG